MRTIPQHYIEHNHRHFRVRCLMYQTVNAQIVVNHRVRTAHGELVPSQVHGTVALAPGGILQSQPRIRGQIGTHTRQGILPDDESLGCQRAAAEQTTHILLSCP